MIKFGYFGYLLVIGCVVISVNSFDAKDDVHFELHTSEHNSNSYEELVPDSYGRIERPTTSFDPSKPTRIYIHGFQSSRKAFMRYAKAFLKKHDNNVNFIVVNWLTGSKTYNYLKARGRVERVGNALTELIDFLVQSYGLNLSTLIVIGHSLGAHIAGIAGKNLKSGKLPIIIGLDPASPRFSQKNTDNRLSVMDAEYVQVIHTNGGHLSIKYPIGDADFYPNWGKGQPGCSGLKSDVCSHSRSQKYYIESLSSNSFFDSVKCASYKEISTGECTDSGPNALMGGDDPVVLKKARGVYYTITNTSPPYALNNTGIIDEVFNV